MKNWGSEPTLVRTQTVVCSLSIKSRTRKGETWKRRKTSRPIMSMFGGKNEMLVAGMAQRAKRKLEEEAANKRGSAEAKAE